MGYAKWIGGAVGWALGGPIGGVMGYWLGKMFSDDSLAMDAGASNGHTGRGGRGGRSRARATRAGDFALSMVVLSAAVMQADERVLKSELDYVKQFFRTNFGQAQAEQLTLAHSLFDLDRDGSVSREEFGRFVASFSALGLAQVQRHVDLFHDIFGAAGGSHGSFGQAVWSAAHERVDAHTQRLVSHVFGHAGAASEIAASRFDGEPARCPAGLCSGSRRRSGSRGPTPAAAACRVLCCCARDTIDHW